jgi:hypothetical protein
LRVRPCQLDHLVAFRGEGLRHPRRLFCICLLISCLALVMFVAPAKSATAASPAVAAAPASPGSPALRDDARIGFKLGPSIYAAPVDEEEELEGGDEEEEYSPGPDPCLVPQARFASLSPLAVRCPWQSCNADAATASSCTFAAMLLAAPAAPCPALATCVQFLC